MRRCRSCRQHNIPKDVPASQFWCGPECKRALAMSRPKATKQPAKPKKKAKSIARLVDDAAVLLQKLVRMKAADANGYCKCVTCGKSDHYTSMQGGHMIERGRLATKLVEEQINPQCPGCNMFRMKTASGVLAYREYMVSMYGEKFVSELIQQSRQTKKFTRHEVEGLIFDFKRRIADQERRLNETTKTESAAA